MEFVHTELKRDTWVSPEIKIKHPEDAVLVVQSLIENLDREMMISIHVATNGRVINASICSIGTMDKALVSPAEVIRTAILSGARSILLLHNHPSGSCQPSTEDLQLAKKMATACEFMGMNLLDFIVVGAYGYTYSLQERDKEWLEPEYRWITANVTSDKKESVEE